MNDDNRQLSDCVVMDILKILREEEKKAEVSDVDAGIIRTCISLILREIKNTNPESL